MTPLSWWEYGFDFYFAKETEAKTSLRAEIDHITFHAMVADGPINMSVRSSWLKRFSELEMKNEPSHNDA
jgi:hypothetical protein